MAITIEIKKNQPSLNSYGQYRTDDFGNSSESGVKNNKFLDDDLYTTTLSNNVNEDIINSKYVLSEPSHIKLKVVIKNNGVAGETKSIRFRVGLIDETAKPGVNDYNSWVNITTGENKILEATYSQQNEGWPSNEVLLDDETIIENFATPSEDDNIVNWNGDYQDNFTNQQDGYNIDESLDISFDDWAGVTTNDINQAFYVAVFSQGHRDRRTGTDVRDSRVQVFKFQKRWFKYESSTVNEGGLYDFQAVECDTQNPQASDNCFADGETQYKGMEQPYEYIGQYWSDFRGNQSDWGSHKPAFNCSEVKMTAFQPVTIDDLSSYLGNDTQYNEVIQYSKVLSKDDVNFFNLNPYRIILYNRLAEFDVNESNQIVDFTPTSFAQTTDTDLQLHYLDDDKVFKTSAPGFVNLEFKINKTNPRSFILSPHEEDNKSAFAFFVIDWNDNNKKFKTWEDVVENFPQSFNELFKRQEDDNTYILSGIKQSNGVSEFNQSVVDFAPYVDISNFYQTSGLKTIKSVVFSYGKDNSGEFIQALRWKLVTTRIFLNQNRITKQDFSELGTVGFTTIPWPYTTPIISGISKLSKYYDSVENTLYNNRFADDEINSEAQVYNALINDELGDSFGDIDVEQTRLFIGAYDMDYLLMLYENDDDDYNPYDDFNYWDGENVFYPLQTGEAEANSPESCVGLIFIGDSSNTTLKRNCLIELNMGDIENDKIVDTGGNKNIGIMIGDYSVQKRSTLVPLTREMNMKLPETDTEDKAI